MTGAAHRGTDSIRPDSIDPFPPQQANRACASPMRRSIRRVDHGLHRFVTKAGEQHVIARESALAKRQKVACPCCDRSRSCGARSLPGGARRSSTGPSPVLRSSEVTSDSRARLST